MRFIFYSPVSFEKWDWRNSVEKGIGGSETSHVEMAWRLAQRGHEVITYAPIPDDCPGEWRNTKWFPIEKVDWSSEGVWILYRCPEAIDNFTGNNPNQKLWFMMQDWSYPTWNEERISKLDKVITLCKAHGKDVLKEFPYVGDKLWLSSNGIKLETIKEVETESIHRNPLRIMYASSPDRGMVPLLKSFARAKEYVPDLELHMFYGFNNIDKLIQGNPKHWLGKTKDEILKLANQDGVTMHGRISQDQLYREWFKSGLWVYQTNFNETSCITSMEAQACGAVPIVNPIYALSENVRHGIVIEGDAYNDRLVCARFASEIVRLALNPKLQNDIRSEMMPDARKRFWWENFVTQWECQANGTEYALEFPEQLEVCNVAG